MLPFFTAQTPPPDDASGDAPAGTGSQGQNGASADKSTESGSGSKVELDLDGAPFLDPEPEDEPPPPPPPSGEKPEAVEAAPGKSRKRLLAIAALGVIVLAGGGVLAFFLLGGEEPALPPDSEVIVVPSSPQYGSRTGASAYNFDWPAFWVEVMDPEGEARFVVCRLHIGTNSPRTAAELRGKALVIRDAVFYYLSHKPYSFLSDSNMLEVIKADIINVINEYIYSDKVEEVLLLDYLIK